MISNQLVHAGLVRSFSNPQLNVNIDDRPSRRTTALVLFCESPLKFETLVKEFEGRIVIFGQPNPSISKVLRLTKTVGELSSIDFECPSAPRFALAESKGKLTYRQDHVLTKNLPLHFRPFCRFDFADEWNNLGFGRIQSSGPFGIAGPWSAPAENRLAQIGDLTYAAVWDQPKNSVLWFNREVGPVDSYEWMIIENFLNSYRPEVRGLLPIFSEIPWNATAAVTMRLDCDEDILSARPLSDLYAQEGVPFSLAIKTDILTAQDAPFLKEILARGGSLLSHSHSHFNNWGVDFAEALNEATTSKKSIEQFTQHPVEFAVSPFHKNKTYSFEALAQAGYLGVVSGLIANDPEALVARAGPAPLAHPSLLTHSQQCMLHGDCILAEGDPLRIYKLAFEIAKASRSLFGYLDHPFSTRYQYGWASESQRLEQHRDFIKYLKSRGASFLSEQQALTFLKHKSDSTIRLDDDGQPVAVLSPPGPWPLAVHWQSEIFLAEEFC